MAAKGDSEAKKSTNYVKQIEAKVDMGKRRKESRTFLGELTPHNVIDQENSEDRELTVVWRDPFRMSVLDFQRSALDKMAGILKVFIKYATETGPLKGAPLQEEGFKHKKKMKEPLEDLHYQLHHVKFQKVAYTRLLSNLKEDAEVPKSEIDAIDGKCDELITARNHTAHQAYIKDDITPPHKPSKSSKNRLGSGHIPLKETKTFTHTVTVISTCLDFAAKVKEGLEGAGEPEKLREVRARIENLGQLKNEFMEFIEYREQERHNLEVFHQDKMGEEERKAAALQVLDMLREKVEKGEDGVTSLLACVVAPRCCITLEPSTCSS